MSNWESIAKQEGVAFNPIERKFAVFILKTQEDLEEYAAFVKNKDNAKVKIYSINLTGCWHNPKKEKEVLEFRCSICNKSNGYDRYMIRNGKIVETQEMAVEDKEKEPFPHIHNPKVLGDEYMKRWRLKPDGTLKNTKELKEQW